MSDAEALRALRTELTRLYPDQEDSLRIVDDAGLDAGHIALSSKAVNNWRNILAEAEKQGKVEAIARLAREEYPRDERLAQAWQGYLAASHGPAVKTRQPETVNLAALAEFLRAGFTADDLRRLCLYQPDWRSVLDGVSSRAGLSELIDALIEFSQTRGALTELVQLAAAERPRQYERFKDRL